MLVMGVPVEKVQRYAVVAATISEGVCTLAARPGFDPGKRLDQVFFAGTPAEFKVQGLPKERLGELLAVELASGLGSKADAGSPLHRRLELGALAVVIAGPLVPRVVEGVASKLSAGVSLLRERVRGWRASR
jgi:hypothetical protein